MPTTKILTGVPTNIVDATSLAGTFNGTGFAMPAEPCVVSWQINFGGGAPATITCVLQASNDNTNWSTIDTSTSNVSGRLNNTYIAAPFVRAAVTAVTGGAGITVTVVVVCKSLNTGRTFGGVKVLNFLATDTVGPADLNENTLFSGIIPAGTFNAAGMLVRLRCWGFVAADGNSKTLRLKFGTDAYIPFSGGVNNISFYAETLLMRRTIINTQTRNGRGWTGTTQSTIQSVALGLTETSDIAVTITTQNGSAVASELTLSAAILDVEGPYF